MSDAKAGLTKCWGIVLLLTVIAFWVGYYINVSYHPPRQQVTATPVPVASMTSEQYAQALADLMADPTLEHTPCLHLTLPKPRDGWPENVIKPNWSDILDEDLRRIDKAFCSVRTRP